MGWREEGRGGKRCGFRVQEAESQGQCSVLESSWKADIHWEASVCVRMCEGVGGLGGAGTAG